MNQPTSPPPLKAGPDTPAQLKRALRALGKQDTHPARFERVADRLGDLLDAPPPAPFEGSVLLRHVSRKVLATRLVVAALTIGATTAVWLNVAPPAARPRATEREPAPAAQRVQTAQVAAPSAPAVAFASAEAPPVRPSTAPVVEPPASSRLRASAAQASVSKRARVRATRGHRARVSYNLPAAGGTTGGAPSAAELATPVAATSSAQTAQPEPVQAAPQPTRAAPEPAYARTEVELLFEARQQIRRHPQRALALLDEHAGRFADGLLAPEREVLAIEALRKLGQSKAAAQRLRSFRARYPDSIHLRRLAREP